MNYLAQFFIKNYKFTLVLTFFVMIFGYSGLTSLKSESFPSVNIGAVVITTQYGGATAEDIETKITKPIEEEIQKVSGLKLVKSTSQAGFSTIVTEVDIDKYDTEKVIADLQRAVDRASGLPTDLKEKPLFSEIKSDEFPVIELAVIGENKDRLRDKIADQLREDIKDNKKVSSVMMTGYTDRQFNIYLNQSGLVANHVSIAEVMRALEQRNVTVPAGELKSSEEQKLVRIEGKAKSAQEIEQIVVRSNFSGRKVLLKDVARVEDGSEEPRTLSSYQGRPATLLVITKKGGADIIDLAKEVEAKLKEYREKYKGQLEFQIFSDEGVRVGDRLSVLTSNGWQGIILVILFLLLFLPGKVGIMTSLSLPLALAATMGGVAVLGYSLNTITIIALVISIGMLVDNAVVISENYTRLRDEGYEIDEALIKTIRELWAPITATALTTIAAFLPMLMTTGVMGQFIRAIPIVVSLALAISLAESFFLLPMRLKLIGYKPNKQGETAQQDWFDRIVLPKFERQVAWLVDNKWKAAGLMSGLMVFTFLLLAFGNRVNLFPNDQTEVYLVRLEAPKGTPVEKTKAIVSEVMTQISEKMGDKMLHIVGTAGESSTDLSDPKGEVGSNTAMIRIFVNRQTQDSVPTNEILTLLRSVENPKLKRISFEALVNGPPVGDPVTVTFRSNDMEQLNQVVGHIKDSLSQVPGIFDAKIDDVFGDDEVTVQVNYDQAARLGLSLADIGLNVRTAIAGQEISDVNLNNKEVNYFLRFEGQDKSGISDLNQIKISDQQGNLIPLGGMAKFVTQSGAPQIKRYDFKRAKTVTANLDDTKITSIQANRIVGAEFEKIKDQYKEVNIVFGGEAEKTNESVQSLFAALILSLIGIFGLLVLIFKSYLSPFIILTTIPLGLVGVSVSFFVHQKDLSFMALIGIIGLGGIIVNSGIILISFIEQLKEETKMSLRDILVKASVLRLRSVVVTSLTTISGLIPTAYGIGGVDYFIIPMALALAWGLTTGTILTLYWVPPAYAIVQQLIARWKGKHG
ncbi:MAG: efflux RND transporter permease subunit [Proteobacteria bacterium]|jgi:multidrug efflux pump subunit AcrB|nr:efflux RND transporter permease subunit [Pseudomonadota bacterium]